MRLRVLPTIRHKYLDTVSHTALSVLDGLLRRFDIVLICNNANAPFALVPRLGRREGRAERRRPRVGARQVEPARALVLPGLRLARAEAADRPRLGRAGHRPLVRAAVRQADGLHPVRQRRPAAAARRDARAVRPRGRAIPALRQPARAREPRRHRARWVPRRGRPGGARRAARDRRRRAVCHRVQGRARGHRGRDAGRDADRLRVR